MSDDALLTCTILIVDDEFANVRLLERLLRGAGYSSLHSTTDPRQVLALYHELQPDLILLDLHMPYLDGFAVMQQLAPEVEAGPFLPRLILTADIGASTKHRALALGATDFLAKPFDRIELALRIRNALHTRVLALQQRGQNEMLERRVRERTQELEIARLDVVERLARVAEFRDDETHEHTQRVGETASVLARVLGLSEVQIETIRRAAPLHDIGKIGIPDAILLKPTKLTTGEFEQMKQHTIAGARILAGGQSDLIRMANQLALTHHERWDGRGYPLGIQGAAIPFVSRIISVVDVFDALTHARPYKPAWPLDRALAEIREQRGRHFDPEVVDAFLSVLERSATLAPARGSK